MKQNVIPLFKKCKRGEDNRSLNAERLAGLAYLEACQQHKFERKLSTYERQFKKTPRKPTRFKCATGSRRHR